MEATEVTKNDDAQMFDRSTIPTHRCKVCKALWRLNPAEPEKYPPPHPFAKETWTLLSPTCGKCCDQEVMGDQIEAL
jgi:hypothetical protein